MNRPADIPEHIYERAELFIDEHRHIEDDRELVARAFMAGQGASAPRPAGLTKLQADVLGYIEQYQQKNRASPSYSEIAAACCIASKSGVHRVVHALLERGAIEMLPRHGRSISIVGRAA